MKRQTPSREITARLWGLAAGRCQFPGCNADLTRDAVSKRSGNFADRAHVHAIKSDGPRGKAWRSASEANDVRNLTLLCQAHHRLIDRHPQEYPAARLLPIKTEHQRRVRLATNFATSSPSHVLYVRAAIGDARLPVLEGDAIWQALNRDGHDPATERPLVLDLATLGYDDGDSLFWPTCETTIRRKLDAAFAEHGTLAQAAHISLFALGPMPILMVLGKILGDTRPVSVYQYDRYKSRWHWRTAKTLEPRSFAYEIVDAVNSTEKRVALVIALSAAIDRELVARAMGTGAYATVTFSTPDPNYSLIRGERDLEVFHMKMRECLNRIEARFGSDCEVHVFPAMPASAAVQMGRLLLPKASPALRIYDHHRARGGFHPTLWLVRRRVHRNRPARSGAQLPDRIFANEGEESTCRIASSTT